MLGKGSFTITPQTIGFLFFGLKIKFRFQNPEFQPTSIGTAPAWRGRENGPDLYLSSFFLFIPCFPPLTLGICFVSSSCIANPAIHLTACFNKIYALQHGPVRFESSWQEKKELYLQKKEKRKKKNKRDGCKRRERRGSEGLRFRQGRGLRVRRWPRDWLLLHFQVQDWSVSGRVRHQEKRFKFIFVFPENLSLQCVHLQIVKFC